jgi:hypothetical protein
MALMKTILSRRNFIRSGATGILLASGSRAWPMPATDQPSLAVLARARAALARHRGSFAHTDRIGIVDFSRPSREPRLFIVDLATSHASAYLVAHGRGSDPGHTGWVERCSNEAGSFESSLGAYATSDLYHGAHGRSMRLQGLDPSNCQAEARAIVVHAAWYVAPQVVQSTGKLGRSEGCFAVSSEDLNAVLTQLGPGRLLYADKS